MIPLSLSISGFLSYRQPVEIDFTAFDLACISGPNGAGKSSLLDAITWALFGQARKRDDSLINTQSEAAEVVFVFAYEGNTYRVQRTNPRGKTTLLEFHILQSEAWSSDGTDNQWKPLTERTLRATQASIEATLRMDYETFVNASFFLQGKADQFTQQRPSDRKKILSNILGLEIWETYRQRAVERRKSVEKNIATLDGQLAEIGKELDEEPERREKLQRLEAELARLAQVRAAQETALENARKIAATLNEQRKLVATLAQQLEAARRRCDDLEQRAQERQQERAACEKTIARADEIEAAYQSWKQARGDVAYWEEIAARFRECEKRRQEPLDEINTVRARLLQEQGSLIAERKSLESKLAQNAYLEKKLTQAQQAIAEADARLNRRAELDGQLQAARQRQAGAQAEIPRIKAEMDELQARITQLKAVEGANCPLCGQQLSEIDRQRLVEELQSQRKTLDEKFHSKRVSLEQANKAVRVLEGQIAALSRVEQELRAHTQTSAQVAAQIA